MWALKIHWSWATQEIYGFQSYTDVMEAYSYLVRVYPEIKVEIVR